MVDDDLEEENEKTLTTHFDKAPFPAQPHSHIIGTHEDLSKSVLLGSRGKPLLYDEHKENTNTKTPISLQNITTVPAGTAVAPPVVRSAGYAKQHTENTGTSTPIINVMPAQMLPVPAASSASTCNANAEWNAFHILLIFLVVYSVGMFIFVLMIKLRTDKIYNYLLYTKKVTMLQL